ncbi:hypothetical protein E2562_038255 [Oryza meyeriana var. granulata]|uniref:Uncharacterized protein n=1 Tax=Oryza meyeriana var. granulata TaxID=110450 RepID=A0A6G1BRW1_9ORYZ|nr:hypothetical protein E2562_038255 [Oryza meyeriana var. granulata]
MSPLPLPFSSTASPCQTPSVRGVAPAVEFVSPPAGAVDDLDADHDDAPLRFRSIDNVLGPATPLGLTNQEVQEELMMVSGEEPTSFAQAEQEKAWRHVMFEEITSIEENKT